MSPNDSDTDRPSPTQFDRVQWLGAVTIATGLGLVVASSAGWVTFDDSTLRLLLTGGIILSAGREGAKAIVEYVTAR